MSAVSSSYKDRYDTVMKEIKNLKETVEVLTSLVIKQNKKLNDLIEDEYDSEEIENNYKSNKKQKKDFLSISSILSLSAVTALGTYTYLKYFRN